MIAVSSCLAGICCKYSGGHNQVEVLEKLYQEGKVMTICPEVLGGLPTPRTPCEIVCHDPLKVEDMYGNDKTKEYVAGAYQALKILKENHIDTVILKAKSPSCGKGNVYDGTFSHTIISKDGVTVKIFKEHGITVYNENELGDVYELRNM